MSGRSGGKFRYMVAGKNQGGNIPDGMEVYEIPAVNWAKFQCVGPIPTSIQAVNKRVWKEWLPGNRDYELDGKYNIEWYSPEGNPTDANYQSQIWLPVKRK